MKASSLTLVTTLTMPCVSFWVEALTLHENKIVVDFNQTFSSSHFYISEGASKPEAHGPSHNASLGSKHSKGGDEPLIKSENCDGGHAVATGLIAGIVIIPLVLFMALHNSPVADLVIRMIDTFISIFLALLWFNAFSCFLKLSFLQDSIPYHEEILSLLQAFVLYAIVIIFAYYWREKENRLLIFCGCGAHYIAFAGISVTGEAQYEASKVHPPDHGPWVSLLIVIISFVFLALFSCSMHYLWRDHLANSKFAEAVEDMELDIVGLVISFAITQTLQQAILGHYPANIHFLQLDSASVAFLAGGPSHGHHPPPTETQCHFVLAWSVGVTVLASLLLAKLDNMSVSEQSWICRTARIIKVILVMCIAWGYLLWGKWMFYDRVFRGHQIFGAMVFAILVTLVSLALLACLSSLQLEDVNVMESVSITIMGISLVVAFSWEQAFNQSMNLLAEQYQVGYGGLVPKLVMAMIIPAFLLPFYVAHLKPRAIRIQENERENRRLSFMSRQSEGTTVSSKQEEEDVDYGKHLSATLPDHRDQPGTVRRVLRSVQSRLRRSISVPPRVPSVEEGTVKHENGGRPATVR